MLKNNDEKWGLNIQGNTTVIKVIKFHQEIEIS